MDRRTMSGQEGRTRLGRPPSGAELVEGITSASEVARLRLAAILRTISGEWTIEEACDALGIARSRFHAMRSRFLAEATALLEPRAPGPRPHVRTEADHEAESLRSRVEELEIEVHTAQIREELASVMPRVLRSKASVKTRAKKKRRTRRWKRR